jgi:hypothetical protein
VGDAHQVAIENFDVSARDGSHGDFLMPWESELAHDEHVERDAECSGDFEAYGNAAAWKREDDDVGPVCVDAKLGGEATSGVVAIAESGAHVVTVTQGAGVKGSMWRAGTAGFQRP